MKNKLIFLIVIFIALIGIIFVLADLPKTQNNLIISGHPIIITNLNDGNYSVSNTIYQAIFKNNSNLAKFASFSKDNFTFYFDIATSQAQWFNSTNGAIMGNSLNPQNTNISVGNNNLFFKNAWNNANLSYDFLYNQMKESIIFSSLPSNVSYADYFRFKTNIYYNSSLQVCVDGNCYLHPSNLKLNTTNAINFEDLNNNTIFYLPRLKIYDSDGNSTTGTYFLNLNNGIDLWYLGIPFDFAKNAVYPITLDPTLIVSGGTTTLCGLQQYDNVIINNSAVVNVCPYNGTAGTGTLNFSVTGTFTLDSSSKINGDGAGYIGGNSTNLSGQGLGGGMGDGYGNGAGYGGVGGNKSSNGGGKSYGSATNKIIQMGSGGSAGQTSSYTANGGAGGVEIIINSLNGNIFGNISSNGAQGDGQSSGRQAGGGGSGGGIFIEIANLNITGKVSANGGAGGWGRGGGGGNDGSGAGGGRIKIFYETISNSSSIIQALNGDGGGDVNSNYAQSGTNGSIYYEQNTSLFYSIILNSPSDNSNSTNPINTFNISVTSGNTLSNISLIINESGSLIIVNTTNISGTSNNSVFNRTFNTGVYLWMVQMCDSSSCYNSSTRTLNVTILPTVNIISPSNNSVSNGTVKITCNGSDYFNLRNINLSIYNSSNNALLISNVSNVSGITNSTIFANNLQMGNYLFSCSSNNNLTSIISNNYSLIVDTTNPIINQIYPTNNIWLSTNNVTFNCSVQGTNLDTLFFYGNFTSAWGINKTASPIVSGNSYLNNLTLSDGFYLWSCAINKTTGNMIFGQQGNYSIGIDTIYPNITINSITTTAASQQISFTTTANDTNLNYCTYSIYNLAGGIDGLNQNISFNCINGTATVSGFATYNLTVYAYDLAGNYGYWSNQFTTSQTSGETVTGGGSGGGSIFSPETPIQQIKVSLCAPRYPIFLQNWKIFWENKTWENFKLMWFSYWDYTLCTSSASIIGDLQVEENQTIQS